MFDLLAAETGLEFGTVFEFFASDRDYTSWIRAQHHRAIAARRDLWMGCSMKAYIQTDASLINSDVLHLSQKGHNLCGRLLAEGTAACNLSAAGRGAFFSFHGSAAGRCAVADVGRDDA